MQTVNIDRINEKKIRFGEVPIKLIKNTYKDVKVKDGYLVDDNGNKIGTKGDMILKTILDKIFQEGCFDHAPRPVYINKYKNAKYYKNQLTEVHNDNQKSKKYRCKRFEDTLFRVFDTFSAEGRTGHDFVGKSA